MKKRSEQLVYSDGRPVRLGDIVTGSVDAEPFLAQVAFIYADRERAQVLPLSRPPSLSAAATLFRRQPRVAEIYGDVPMMLRDLRLHQRCNCAMSEHAVVIASEPKFIAGADWRESPLFSRLPKPQRRWRKRHDRTRGLEAGL